MADDPDNYQVRALPNAGAGQLPERTMGGQRVIRVYLSVAYDYSEKSHWRDSSACHSE
jgi:hypothetical protein